MQSENLLNKNLILSKCYRVEKKESSRSNVFTN
ncbi:hypothetical protein RIR_e4303_A0A2N0QLV1_9GLOM [Rhizophagus irregularis DAOM 181602=DAOM 197198]|nr:hypothetical protein RIR_e4303_A0A2N0QLV1_9GLOM [Rhizophagus irregularis DAOM 181602=DAOM 197198]